MHGEAGQHTDRTPPARIPDRPSLEGCCTAETVGKRIAEDLKNAPDPARAARQGAAAAPGGDRRARLKTIKAPTVVLHGADDPMFPVEQGKDTAASIPGAELRIIPGLGHDLPDALVPVFADAITAAAKRSRNP